MQYAVKFFGAAKDWAFVERRRNHGFCGVDTFLARRS
jgi:hypothetical protein